MESEWGGLSLNAIWSGFEHLLGQADPEGPWLREFQALRRSFAHARGTQQNLNLALAHLTKFENNKSLRNLACALAPPLAVAGGVGAAVAAAGVFSHMVRGHGVSAIHRLFEAAVMVTMTVWIGRKYGIEICKDL